MNRYTQTTPITMKWNKSGFVRITSCSYIYPVSGSHQYTCNPINIRELNQIPNITGVMMNSLIIGVPIAVESKTMNIRFLSLFFCPKSELPSASTEVTLYASFAVACSR